MRTSLEWAKEQRGESIVDKIDSISGAVDDVKSEVNELSAKTITTTENTKSVTLTQTNSIDGTKGLKADVNLSAVEGNILLEKNDGLYTQVDYNALTNAIIINGESKTLNSGSIIDKIEYISSGSSAETLVITYHTTGSQEALTVSVPLTDLIEEYVFKAEATENYNVKFHTVRNVDGQSQVEADVDLFDCGVYESYSN